ncbi:baculoviral IAP repeat-containing protein 3-like [Haliotis rufescens]|uniref:baculoviral IAP repeat-containing protein 3-like n=1 Tax=Haliotis rufescens TaxID=6454 RepID=UPI00201F3DED|nr:baculoviral IAP repeat-containing protein 3-like [Haliotis rufescens]XP_046370865.2 baculoviral IAP repeat-containing protein 3-like [Haliotis rufescens]XP_046370866.2 baculoviral IAP repeat-containing protein 3-like [Haliotis rufescens]
MTIISHSAGNNLSMSCLNPQLQESSQNTIINEYDSIMISARYSFINIDVKTIEYGGWDSNHQKTSIHHGRKKSDATWHRGCTAPHHCQHKRTDELLNNQITTKKYVGSTAIYYNAPMYKMDSEPEGCNIKEEEQTNYTTIAYVEDKCDTQTPITGNETDTQWELSKQCSQEGRHSDIERSEFRNGWHVSKSLVRLHFNDIVMCSYTSLLFESLCSRAESEQHFESGFGDNQFVNDWKRKTHVAKEKENFYTCWKQCPEGMMNDRRVSSHKQTLFPDMEFEAIKGLTGSHTPYPKERKHSHPSDSRRASSGLVADTGRALVAKERGATPLECDIKETSRIISELCALYNVSDCDFQQTHEEYGGTCTTQNEINKYLDHHGSTFPDKDEESVESKLPSKDIFRHIDMNSYIQSLQTLTVAPFLSLQGYFVKIANHEHVSNDEKMAYEGLRLSSFSGINVNASCIRLAAAGFYATGDRDETRCFSCGIRHRGWQQGDNIFIIHKQISPTCLHAMGTDQITVPINPPPIADTTSPPVALANSSDDASLTLVMHKDPNIITTADDTLSSLEADSTSGAGIESATRSARENPNLHVVTYNKYKSSAESVKDDATVAFPSVSDEGVHSSRIHTNHESVTDDNIITVLPASREGAVSAQLQRRESTVQSDSATGTRYNSGLHKKISLRFDNAIYPNYCDISTRLSSFLLWPKEHCKKPEELVQVGFFYAGLPDCVRCFVCGIGLKTWEKGDNPWVEHVRWRASCAYVRAIKGEAFITQTLAEEGERSRERDIPEIRNQAGNTNDAGDVLEREACHRALEMGYSRDCVSQHALAILRNQSHVSLTLDVLLGQIMAEEDLEMAASAEGDYDEQPAAAGSGAETTSSSGTELQGNNELVTIDNGYTQDPTQTIKAAAAGSTPTISILGAEHQQEQNQQVKQKHLQAGAAKARIPMGHADETVSWQRPSRQASEHTVSDDEDEGYEGSSASKGNTFQSLPVMPSGNIAITKQKKSSARRKSTKEQLKATEEETQQLKESNLCKICLEDPANIVFLPCGHLVACAMCAPALERCPVCRTHIRGSVRVHLAAHLKDKT